MDGKCLSIEIEEIFLFLVRLGAIISEQNGSCGTERFRHAATVSEHIVVIV